MRVTGGWPVTATLALAAATSSATQHPPDRNSGVYVQSGQQHGCEDAGNTRLSGKFLTWVPTGPDIHPVMNVHHTCL